jgi:hypothetical protein
MDHQGRDTIQGTDVVELAYRPTRRDIRTGIGVRDRIRRLVVLRWALVMMFLALAVRHVVTMDAVTSASGAFSLALAVMLPVLIWSLPHLQVHHVLKLVAWQGEYRTTVTDAGIAAETEHTTLVQRWSLFRGYRETRDHMVLLSRDPNILVLEVLPKRGLRSPEDAERLRALLDRHLSRV